MLQNIFLAVFIGQIGNMILRGLKGCLDGKAILKLIGIISTLGTTFSHYFRVCCAGLVHHSGANCLDG
jgi:hypothetical protein